MLEKAYAKIYGSYHSIKGGLTGNAIRDLTGAPKEELLNKVKPEYLFFWLANLISSYLFYSITKSIF